jgi:hypothetical protein
MPTKVATKESTKVPTILTLEQIAAIDDRAPIDVPVEAWGGNVQVRALTLQQINECNKRAANPARAGEVHKEKRNGWYLVEGMVAPTITIDVAEVWLTERAAGPVAEILGAILEHSGLTERAKDAAKSGAAD